MDLVNMNHIPTDDDLANIMLSSEPLFASQEELVAAEAMPPATPMPFQNSAAANIRFSSTLLGSIKEAKYDVSPTRNIIVFNNGCWAEGSCCQVGHGGVLDIGCIRMHFSPFSGIRSTQSMRNQLRRSESLGGKH